MHVDLILVPARAAWALAQPNDVTRGLFATLEPWDLFRAFLRQIWHWITTELDRTLVSDLAVFLMVGGLAMLTLLLILILMGAAFSGQAQPVSLGQPKDDRLQLRPIWASQSPGALPGGSETTVPGSETPAVTPAIDRPMVAIVKARLGEPRILYHRPSGTRIRLYRCRGCRGVEGSEATDASGGCPSELEDLRTVFVQTTGRQTLKVRETACRRRGDDFCDFEVTP